MRFFLLALTLVLAMGLFNWAFGSRQESPSDKRRLKTPSSMTLLVTDWTESYRLYGQPHAIWLDQYNFVGANRRILKDVLDRAAQKGQNPELVIYAIPLRDLGQSSEGGFDRMDDYVSDNELNAKIIADFVKQTGLTPRIYLEPDALSLSVQYREDNHYNPESEQIYRERTGLMPRLVKLYRQSGAMVYLDAAHSDWFDYGDENVARMAQALNDAGVREASGIVTNVSNRQTLNQGERNEWHYLGRLLPQLQNRNLDVVVDTSRNGGGTKPRQYFLAPNGMLIDNETPTGRLVGSWKQDSDGQVRLFPMFGKPKTLNRLLSKEKYQYNLKRSILTAPKWLDPVGDVQPGPAPTDRPPSQVADRIDRLRYIKPPDDCDGALNCPAGKSKHDINTQTAAKQPKDLQIPSSAWL